MKSFDDSLKHLVHQHPEAFIGFGLGDLPVTVLKPLPVALAARSREVDDAYLVEVDGEQRVVHLEYDRRNQGERELSLDVAEAQVRLYRREGIEVLTQVWDLYGTRRGKLLEDRVLQYGPGCRSTYRRVNLRAVGFRDLLDRGAAALWPLVPLTADGVTNEAVLGARDAILRRTDVSSAQRADHLAVLHFLSVAEGFPMQLLLEYISKMTLMESPLYREIFHDGEIQGKAEFLLQVLMNRVGKLDPAVKEIIRGQRDTDLLSAWFAEAIMAPDAEAALRLVRKITAT